MSNPRTTLGLTEEQDYFYLPRIFGAELGLAFYNFLVSEVAKFERGGHSISSVISAIYMYMNASRAGREIHNAMQDKPSTPEHFVAKEASSVFTLTALLHLAEGNYIASSLSASAAVMSVFMMRMAYGEKLFKQYVDLTLVDVANVPRRAYNSFISFFTSAPNMQVELVAPAAENKKNR